MANEPDQSFWRRVAQNRLWDVGAVLLAVICVWRIVLVLPTRARAYDFAHYYVSSHLLLEGKDPYHATIEPTMTQGGFTIDPYAIKQMAVNTPFFFWSFTPLAALGPDGAFWGWVTVQAVSLAVILWMTCRLLGDRLSRRGRLFVVTLAVASTPVFWHFYFSQMQLLLAAVLLVAFAQRRAGRDLLACLLVVVAGLLKMYPLVLLPWFVWRGPGSWGGRIQRAGGAAGLALLVVLVTGPGRWMQSLQQQRELVELCMVNNVFNETIPSLVINCGLAPGGFAASPTETAWWCRVGFAAGLLVIGAAYWRCFAVAGDDRAQFALLIVAMVAGIPYAWGHYLVFLIFPVACVACGLRGSSSAWRFLWLVVIVLALNNFGRINFMLDDPWLAGRKWVKMALNYIPLAGVVGTGVFLWGKQRAADG